MMACSHMSPCPVTSWSLTQPELWVATLAFPSVLWPCLAVAHMPHVAASGYCCASLSPDLGQPIVPVLVSCWLSFTQPLLLFLAEPQGPGPDLIQCWAASRFSQRPPTRPSAQMVCADIRGDKAASYWPNLDSSCCSVIFSGCRMEMDWSPKRADAVVTCAPPLPVAQPVTTDWLATGGWGWQLFLICPAGKHQWMKENWQQIYLIGLLQSDIDIINLSAEKKNGLYDTLM